MNFTFVGDLVMGTRATKMISVLSQKNSLQGRGTHDNKNETSLVFVFCTHCKNWPYETDRISLQNDCED